jgi:hypothetical protein
MSLIFPWLGIAICISQSAMFSGMNLALFSVSRLRLEVEAASGSADAVRVLGLRRDANFALTTILWGNVAINVLLALLSNSVMSGVVAFLFSTILITFLGEIVPQAYCSRYGLRTAARLAPLLRFYQFLLFPVAKPTALMLDAWLGREGVNFLREREFRQLIRRHIESSDADIDRLEGLGALNFLAIDDMRVQDEGEPLNPLSIVEVNVVDGRPVFPAFAANGEDPFLRRVQASNEKWVVVVDPSGTPVSVLDADRFLRSVMFDGSDADPARFCHRPIIVRNPNSPLGSALLRFRPQATSSPRDESDSDVILLWAERKQVITSDDILERLMRGVSATAATAVYN